MRMFVRGLARAGMGQAEAALADYQLASRMAFAHPDIPHAAALAHYYRGVWQFRRKDFARAEDEFASALNQDPGADLRADATGWRYMAAVAGGACEASGRKLEAALREASGFFPRARGRDAARGLPRRAGQRHQKTAVTARAGCDKVPVRYGIAKR